MIAILALKIFATTSMESLPALTLLFVLTLVMCATQENVSLTPLVLLLANKPHSLALFHPDASRAVAILLLDVSLKRLMPFVPLILVELQSVKMMDLVISF
jgi:hypothetical protein